MKKKLASYRRSAYLSIGIINLCTAGMFLAILLPQPVAVYAQPILTAPEKKLSAPNLKNIALGIPNRVVVESVGIDLPVKTGSYDAATKTWTLDEASAFYADRSVPINDSNGSTLIYAHARFGLFAKLPEITNGSTALVYTDSGKVFSYQFESSRQVTPDDTSIFVATGPPTLALQTCSGPFDVYRTLVLFRLKEVSTV